MKNKIEREIEIEILLDEFVEISEKIHYLENQDFKKLGEEELDTYQSLLEEEWEIEEKLKKLEISMIIKEYPRREKREERGKEKRKLKALREYRWHISYDNGDYVKRCYLGSKGKYYRRKSNKTIRQSREKIKNGGNYRKLYDYWWEIF